jgi:hypothetical protein
LTVPAGRLASQGAGRAGRPRRGGAKRRVRPCPLPVFELPMSSSILTSSCVTHVPCPCVTPVPCLSVTYVRLHRLLPLGVSGLCPFQMRWLLLSRRLLRAALIYEIADIEVKIAISILKCLVIWVKSVGRVLENVGKCRCRSIFQRPTVSDDFRHFADST